MNHQGVTAHVMPHSTLTDEEFLAHIASTDMPIIIALDSIQDPHNLGAIIRTAVAAGVDGLILPKDRSAPLTGTVSKISAGALPHLPICLTTNLVRMLQKLQAMNIWICSTLKDSAQTIYTTDFLLPLCLVIGSEEKGVRPLVKKQCDMEVSIPMNGRIDSLNASVAAAVILFEIRRQRTLS
jgi:23S rRNA (guanosine2251-2'-O)-methyltransferase